MKRLLIAGVVAACVALLSAFALFFTHRPSVVRATIEVKVVNNELSSLFGRPLDDVGTLTLDGPEEISQLLQYFDQFGEGRKSSQADGWDAPMRISLRYSDMKQLVIATDGRKWTEGLGDWDLSDNARSKIVELFKTDHRVRWSR